MASNTEVARQVHAALQEEKQREREERQNAKVNERYKTILATLADLGGKVFHDEDILFQGDKLTIPKNMTLAQAKKFIEMKEAELEKQTDFTRVFNYRPYDGAWCAWNFMKRTFGVVGHKDRLIKTMFGPEKAPPMMVDIPIDVGRTEQIPWGRVELPFMPGAVFEFETFHHEDKGPLFWIQCTSPKKFRYEIEGIFRGIEEELRERSLYRGKAFDGQENPEFIDLSSVDPTRVVYSKEVMAQLEANIWAQLRHTDEFVKMGIPLKRAVLIHGPFGCIHGDARIGVNRAGKGFTLKLSDLVTRLNGEDQRYAWDPSIPTYVQREDGGMVRLGKIEAAWCSGEKNTFTVTTESGRQTRATDEHPFLTSEGWRRLDQLLVGDEVLVRGPQQKGGRAEKTRYRYVAGLDNHPFSRSNNVVDEHRLVIEAQMNKLGFDEYVAKIKSGLVGELVFLDPSEVHVHHSDGDPFNNDPENLQVMTEVEHHRLHAEETFRNVLYQVVPERIVSIQPHGVEMTYDIEVADDPHNFIADGFVVHNTGKTLAALLTGQEAARAGWTFIKARPGRDNIFVVMQTARLYEPCVVFYEDVDQIVDAEAQDRAGVAQLLDVFDGIEAKGTKILCVLTTNYPDKIHKGMARPGRLDAMIEISELDSDGVEALVRTRLSADMLEDEIDWAAVFAAATEYKPAFVTEFADRTMRYVIAEHGTMDGHKVGTRALVNAAHGLRPQYEKMVGAKEIEDRFPIENRIKQVVEATTRETIQTKFLNKPKDNTHVG
jgi:hypothetical protein